MGIVNGVNGAILLPDDWSSTVHTLNYTDRADAPFSTNEITLDDWETMETNGAVFLPAAGGRVGIRVSFASSRSYYWSASYDVYFPYEEPRYYSSYLNLISDYGRVDGRSVRLVKNVP